MPKEELNQRVPPYSLEAEQACIGAMLESTKAINDVMELLQKSDFFDHRNQTVFSVIQTLFNESLPIDAVSVSEKLKSLGQFDEIGGTAYLSALITNAPYSENVSYHASIIKDKSILRALINASRNIIDLAYQNSGNTEAVSNEAEKFIFDVTSRRLKTKYVKLKDVVSDTLVKIEDLSKSEHGMTGIPTGYNDFDEMTNGLQRQDMIVLAARPSMGKSAFALNLASRMTQHDPTRTVLIFSLEMSNEEIIYRLISSESGIELSNIKSGKIYREEEWNQLVEAVGRLSLKNIILDDTPTISLNEIKAKSRRVKSSEESLDMIIIDHLQLVSTNFVNQGNYSRVNEVSYISRNIKALAKELDVPVIILSQLSRESEKRTSSHRPQLSDLRESGAIEQDADIVIFLYREGYYNLDQTESIEETQVIIAKFRNGQPGILKMNFEKSIQRFEQIAYHGDEIQAQQYE